MLCRMIAKAEAAGLKITLHIAEVRAFSSRRCILSDDAFLLQTAANPAAETLQFLACGPSRLGHATFLDDEAKEIVKKEKMCIEICLSSNLLYGSLLFSYTYYSYPLAIHGSCNTVKTLDAHHIRYYLEHNHPIAICVSPYPSILLVYILSQDGRTD
jgi:adenosine deaminase